MEPVVNTFSRRAYGPVGQACLAAVWPCLYLAAGLYGLQDYMEWRSLNFIIGLAALPLLLSAAQPGPASHRFGLLGAILLLFSLLIHAKTLLYFSWCSLLLCLYESRKGKVTSLPLMAVFMMAPICSYFAGMFGFPVRLWLTAIAGGILGQAGQAVSVSGNIITMQQQDFSVDPACMGLNMLITSLLCGLVMIAAIRKKEQLQLSFPWVLLSLLLIFLLNIVANLLRILLLVSFRLMPDNIMHELTGIICLLVYVLAPGWFLLRKLVRLGGKPYPEPVPAMIVKKKKAWLHWLLFPLLVLSVYRSGRPAAAGLPGALPQLPGYTSSWYNGEIMKMESSTALIYIKPLKGFFYSDHNPLICWTACGYTFEQVAAKQYGTLSLWTGMLCKGRERLYTAWWYDNGSTATASQWQWRWLAIRGAPAFHIINVTAASEAGLQQELKRLGGWRQQVLHNRSWLD